MYGMTKHKICREMDGEYGQREFCVLEVELKDNRDGLPALSICGVHGYVLTERQARKEALNNWEWYFDEDGNLAEANERWNTRFRSSKSAAKYVIDNDGEYHGLDVVYVPDNNDDNKVFIGTAFGQIREELLRFFPEIAPVLKYHLNDMVRSKDDSEWLYRPLPADVKAFGADPKKWLSEHATVAERIADRLLAPMQDVTI